MPNDVFESENLRTFVEDLLVWLFSPVINAVSFSKIPLSLNLLRLDLNGAPYTILLSNELRNIVFFALLNLIPLGSSS